MNTTADFSVYSAPDSYSSVTDGAPYETSYPLYTLPDCTSGDFESPPYSPHWLDDSVGSVLACPTPEEDVYGAL